MVDESVKKGSNGVLEDGCGEEEFHILCGPSAFWRQNIHMRNHDHEKKNPDFRFPIPDSVAPSTTTTTVLFGVTIPPVWQSLLGLHRSGKSAHTAQQHTEGEERKTAE